MPTTSITNATLGATGAAGATVTNPKAALGKDAFLKLLVEQLKHQNPLDPTDEKEFVGQMTQFSMLEQVTNLTGTNDRLARSAGMDEAIGLMGKTVSWKGEGEQVSSGKVERILVTDGKPKLVIAGSGQEIDPAKVTEVR